MHFKYLLSGLISLCAITTAANAATVSATSSVIAEFDVNGLTPGTITGFGYQCFTTCSSSDISDPRYLAVDGAFQILLGSSAGSDDIASVLIDFDPDPPEPLNNIFIGSSLINFDVTNSLSSIFITLVFVNDLFGVDAIQLRIGQTILDFQQITEISVSDVPLPTALPLFIAGIAGMGAATRRKHNAS